jgi:hypothetical protein
MSHMGKSILTSASKCVLLYTVMWLSVHFGENCHCRQWLILPQTGIIRRKAAYIGRLNLWSEFYRSHTLTVLQYYCPVVRLQRYYNITVLWSGYNGITILLSRGQVTTVLQYYCPVVRLPVLINVHMPWVCLGANQYDVTAALFTMLEHVWFTETVGNNVRVNIVY